MIKLKQKNLNNNQKVLNRQQKNLKKHKKDNDNERSKEVIQQKQNHMKFLMTLKLVRKIILLYQNKNLKRKDVLKVILSRNK